MKSLHEITPFSFRTIQSAVFPWLRPCQWQFSRFDPFVTPLGRSFHAGNQSDHATVRVGNRFCALKTVTVLLPASGKQNHPQKREPTVVMPAGWLDLCLAHHRI